MYFFYNEKLKKEFFCVFFLDERNTSKTIHENDDKKEDKIHYFKRSFNYEQPEKLNLKEKLERSKKIISNNLQI
jgi:hypothetical protein